MLIDFFYTLRSAKLPVSVKEYLTLVEALKEGVVGPNSDGGFKIDDFYYLARTALVKDEKHYDKFDRAFAGYFKGVEMLTDFTKEVPLGRTGVPKDIAEVVMWLSGPCYITGVALPVSGGNQLTRLPRMDELSIGSPV